MTAREADGDYLDYIRSEPCLICHAPPPNDPHHLLSNVMGAKGADESAIPLCREHHREYHNLGHAAFEQERGMARKRGLWYYAWRHLKQYRKDHDH